MVELATLKKRYEFLAAAKANRVRAKGFYLQAQPRGEGFDNRDADSKDKICFGLTCSRKVGDAVERNRAKRRLRHAACAVLPEYGRVGWNYVLIGLFEATVNRDFDELVNDLRKAVQRIHDMPLEGDEALRGNSSRSNESQRKESRGEKSRGFKSRNDQTRSDSPREREF